MKKDIPDLKVEEVGVAIVPKDVDRLQEELWDVFLINLKSTKIKSVLISSRGYGEMDGQQANTTVLRHFFEEIAPQTAVQVEPIQPKLFKIANEFWVSFVLEEHMYDKKYVFVKGSIDRTNFINVPLINRKGIMIK